MLNESILTENVLEEIAFIRKTQAHLALDDFLHGLTKWRTWLILAYQDIKVRYRRSILGPFWITLSMAVTVYSMGFLYSRLFHVDVNHYFPYLVSGMVSWSLISSLIPELTETFIVSGGLIKQITLPYTVHIHRVIARNYIIFFHNVLVIIPIIFLFHEFAKVNLHTLGVFFGLFCVYLNALLYGLALGMLGARFRDVLPIVKSLITVIFFVTPVLWDPKILSPKAQFFVMLNPFYSFIEIVRAPLIGQGVAWQYYAMVLFTTLLGVALCSALFIKYRTRIVYWI